MWTSSSKLSAIGETITVTGEQPGVEATQTQIGQVIHNEQLENLPVGIRSFVNFASLAPGVNANFARAGASFTAGALSSNGQDNRFANFTIDGAPNNDDFVGQTAAAQTGISLDAIQEFQVLTNQASAEYGRNMGTVLNMVTKSGTNTFGGFGVALRPPRRARSHQRVHEAGGIAQAAVPAGAVRRQCRRTDRQGSHALLRQRTSRSS